MIISISVTCTRALACHEALYFCLEGHYLQQAVYLLDFALVMYFSGILYIDLEEKSENHWTNRIFKEKGQGDERSIVIRLDELIDFIHTTEATFAVFQVKRNDDNFRAERYFLVYLVF
jgi:hypothetical protein